LRAKESHLAQAPLVPHAADEWFVLEVIAESNRIRTLVDGQLTADLREEKPRFQRGLFALQIWGGATTVVHFRKIEIKEAAGRCWSAVCETRGWPISFT
jgi:hypothetical protein